MGNTSVNQNRQSTGQDQPQASLWGPKWLVEERDACGVGFIANQQGQASHALVAKALKALDCMEHRGGCCADQDSGDGAGVMTAIPWQLLSAWAIAQGHTLVPERTGVGMVFLPLESAAAARVRQTFEQVVTAEGLRPLGWRAVPVQPQVLGQLARQNQPLIEQIVVESAGLTGDDLERVLYLVRRDRKSVV